MNNNTETISTLSCFRRTLSLVQEKLGIIKDFGVSRNYKII